jgi:hypothetical protein
MNMRQPTQKANQEIGPLQSCLVLLIDQKGASSKYRDAGASWLVLKDRFRI